MNKVERMLITLGIVIGLLIGNTCYAEGVDFKSPQHQVRMGVGFGGAYVLSHLYKKQLGLGHETSIVGAVLTMAALSLAYDYSQTKNVNWGNTGATAIGGGVAVLTFSLFDGSEKNTKDYTDYSEMRKKDRSPAEAAPVYPNYFQAPPSGNQNTNTININVNGEKVKTDAVKTESAPEKKE